MSSLKVPDSLSLPLRHTMFFPSPFLALPVDRRSGSASSSSLFAGDSKDSNSTDITPPRSPTSEGPKTIQPMSFMAASITRRISLPKVKLPPQTNENEQASRLNGESTPKTPVHSAKTGIFAFSPLLHTQLREDDTGYETEPEDEGSLHSPRQKRYSRARKNPSMIPARMRGVTAPVICTENPPSSSGFNLVPPAIHRQNRPTAIDLAVIPPLSIKQEVGKAAIGLGLGLPTNHPIHPPRASTAPVLTSPPISHASITKLLPCRPFSPVSPRTNKIQNPRLQPTVVPDSPSPIEMLPSRLSYFQSHNYPSPLQDSLLPHSPLRDVISETLRLQSTSVSGMPSPMELYSSFAYDTVYPRTPFVSPEAHANPSFGAY